jgi:hypothetical protein
VPSRTRTPHAHGEDPFAGVSPGPGSGSGSGGKGGSGGRGGGDADGEGGAGSGGNDGDVPYGPGPVGDLEPFAPPGLDNPEEEWNPLSDDESDPAPRLPGLRIKGPGTASYDPEGTGDVGARGPTRRPGIFRPRNPAYYDPQGTGDVGGGGTGGGKRFPPGVRWPGGPASTPNPEGEGGPIGPFARPGEQGPGAVVDALLLALLRERLGL